MFLLMLLIFMIVGTIGEIIYHQQKNNPNEGNSKDYNIGSDNCNDGMDDWLLDVNNHNYYNKSTSMDNDGIFNDTNYGRDPFKIGQYKNELDFYDDNLEEFSCYEETEDYFKKHSRSSGHRR